MSFDQQYIDKYLRKELNKAELQEFEDILETQRGKIKDITSENTEYDEELAEIGKEEKKKEIEEPEE